MKTLLVFPRVEEKKPHNSPPLGVAQLAAVMEERGQEVKIADLTFTTWEGYISILKRYEPDVLGVSALTMYMENSLIAAAIAKARDENITTVFGGPHPTIDAEWVASRKWVDFVCVGESDYTLPDLVEHLHSNKPLSEVKGILHKEDGVLKRTEPRPYIEDLSKLPFPDRKLLPMGKYLKKTPIPLLSNPCTNTVFTRGCPMVCSFCQPTTKMTWGAKQRITTPERAVEEMRLITDEYRLRSVYLMDDTLTLNRKWVMRFCELLKAEKLGVTGALNTRVHLIDREMVRALKSAGVIQLQFGVESGSDRILKEVMNKGITVEMTEKAFQLCREEGMLTRANIMLGTPTETAEDMELTRRMLQRIRPDVINMSITCPLFGTYLYDSAVGQGIMAASKWSDYTAFKRGLLKGVDYDAVERVITEVKADMMRLWWSPEYMLSNTARMKANLRRTWSLLQDGNIRHAASTMLQMGGYIEAKIQ